jgi:hypothetical protein
MKTMAVVSLCIQTLFMESKVDLSRFRCVMNIWTRRQFASVGSPDERLAQPRCGAGGEIEF